MATFAGGVFMSLVHPVAARMETAQYGEFFTLLRCLILLGIPTIGLQTIFAHQAVTVASEEDKQRLAKTTRTIMFSVFLLWLLMALGVFIAQDFILTRLRISNALTLWMTMFVVLASLWLPILRGLLQGQQSFFGLGWIAIIDGVGRFCAMLVIVLVLKWQAAGAMFGALLGQVGAILLGIWLTREVFKGIGSHFEWKPWLAKAIPLTFGFGSLLFMQNADVIYVQSVFDKDNSPFYMPAAMIGFAMIQFTMPLVAVMFPKIIRSARRAEKSDALHLTFWTTAGIGSVAALGCTILPELPIRILFFTKPEFLISAPLIPWFAWAMLFMMLASVMVGNLLARERFRIVPWLSIVAVLYGITLYWIKPQLLAMEPFMAFRRIVQIMAVYNFVLAALAVVFSWKPKSS